MESKLTKRRGREFSFAKDKRALSEIVATLIVILLVIIAIGIIWTVVRGVIDSGAEQIRLSGQCLNIDVQAVAVEEVSTGLYSVRLRRGSDNEDPLDGVVITFFNGTVNTQQIEFGSPIGPGDTLTNASIDTTGRITGMGTSNLTNANRIEFRGYFEAQRDKVFCPDIWDYEF